ncbi:hypothetical protein FRB91_005138 [Serendipita sp. 411]|nr:hypothetical protein FRB91_005138 [Serendipita sp. 411]
MPFAYADMYTSTLADDSDYASNRPGSQSTSNSLSISSTHFFVTSILLFFATALQFYFNPAAFSLSTTTSTMTLADVDTFASFTYDIVYVFNNALSPLMLLALGVGMAGTFCRGIELVIQATAYKGKL